MATPYYSSEERVLVAALPPGRKTQYVAVRMESAMSRTWSKKKDSVRMTPFPQEAIDILQHHNATRILVQVGTSASREFGISPLDEIEPWHTRAIMGQQQQRASRHAQRLDLGPSGVRVFATLQVPHNATFSFLRTQFETLLRDIVSRRILLAPLFSISIPRLHRHWFSWPDPNDGLLRHFELFLPTEGSALSSEGMREFATAFSPCYNQSGIFHWNTPKIMSELFVKRHSSARHSLWIQLEQQQQQETEQSTTTITTTRLVKGLQFQPNIAGESSEFFPTCTSSITNASNRTVALADVFPKSTRHQRCPFVQEATLETVKMSHVRLLEPSNTIIDDSVHVNRHTLDPDHWKDPWITILPIDQARQSTPRYSIHQALRQPRGVSYSGQLVTQVVLHPFGSSSTTTTTTITKNKCSTSVHVQWFLPPIVVPQWQSLQVIWEDAEQQVERLLDWRKDLHGSITMIDPKLGSTDLHNKNVFHDGTLHFQIPHWNVPSSAHAQTLTFSLDYRPAFLSFENFPGDANRGVEIPPASAIFVETCNETQLTSSPTSIQLYSNSLLLIPPVPDMSMPVSSGKCAPCRVLPLPFPDDLDYSLHHPVQCTQHGLQSLCLYHWVPDQSAHSQIIRTRSIYIRPLQGTSAK
jgi:Gpi16 subunit, GPI transamidase component